MIIDLKLGVGYLRKGKVPFFDPVEISGELTVWCFEVEYFDTLMVKFEFPATLRDKAR